LDFVHRLYFNKITTFRKLELLPSSGKKKGSTETIAVGPPGPDLRLAQPGGKTARLSVFLFYLKTEEEPASETLKFY
jgi:hypothetical protein